MQPPAFDDASCPGDAIRPRADLVNSGPPRMALRTLRWLFGVQAGLSAYYLLNLLGGCRHCSRSLETLLIATLGMLFYSICFSGFVKARPFYVHAGLLAGLVHVLLGGLLLDKRHWCFICALSCIVGLASVGVSLIISSRSQRICYAAAMTVALFLALYSNPLRGFLDPR